MQRWRHRSVSPTCCVCVYIQTHTHIYEIHVEWKGLEEWPLRFQIDGRDGDGAVEWRGRNIEGTIDNNSGAAQYTDKHIQFSLSLSFYLYFCFLLCFFYLLLFSFKLRPSSADFHTAPLSNLSLHFSLSIFWLSFVFGWPVLETEPRAAFLHLLLSGAVVYVLLLFSFWSSTPPFLFFFRFVQNNNLTWKKKKKIRAFSSGAFSPLLRLYGKLFSKLEMILTLKVPHSFSRPQWRRR